MLGFNPASIRPLRSASICGSGYKVRAGANPVSREQMYLFVTEDRPTKDRIDPARFLDMLKALLAPFSAPTVKAVHDYLEPKLAHCLSAVAGIPPSAALAQGPRRLHRRCRSCNDAAPRRRRPASDWTMRSSWPGNWIAPTTFKRASKFSKRAAGSAVAWWLRTPFGSARSKSPAAIRPNTPKSCANR
jgi:hypothetical protein